MNPYETCSICFQKSYLSGQWLPFLAPSSYMWVCKECLDRWNLEASLDHATITTFLIGKVNRTCPQCSTIFVTYPYSRYKRCDECRRLNASKRTDETAVIAD